MRPWPPSRVAPCRRLGVEQEGVGRLERFGASSRSRLRRDAHRLDHRNQLVPAREARPPARASPCRAAAPRRSPASRRPAGRARARRASPPPRARRPARPPCRISACAVSKSTKRGLVSTTTKPTMSAPASTAMARSDSLVMPQILTLTMCRRPARLPEISANSGAQKRRKGGALAAPSVRYELY